MPYTPPHTFVDGTIITSTDFQSNSDDLRIYLHSGILSSDIQNTKWIDTRHIQPPEYEPFQAVQHGVTGHQGGQDGGGDGVRLTFLTKFLTGGGISGLTQNWAEVPSTSFQVQIRRAAKVVFHYWYEVECGPDDSTNGQQVTEFDRLVWVAPYIGNISLRQPDAAQEAQNHQEGWRTTYPIGASRTYPVCGAYGQRDGTLVVEAPLGTTTVGLCYYSQIDRVAVVNWGIAIETFYL